MTLRAVCPNCSSPLSAPDAAAGKVVRCPTCRTSMRLSVAEAMPSGVREDDDPGWPRQRRPVLEDADPPHRLKRRKAADGVPGWVKLAAGGVSFVVFAVGGFLAVHPLLGHSNKPPGAAGAAPPGAAAGVVGGVVEGVAGRSSAGKGYIPRVSEQRLQEFLKTLKDSEVNQVTEEQVYAIMGEPTRRSSPVTGWKNGQVWVVYTAYWEVPGSGVTSQISFANGRLAGMILGLEITPHGAGSRK